MNTHYDRYLRTPAQNRAADRKALSRFDDLDRAMLAQRRHLNRIDARRRSRDVDELVGCWVALTVNFLTVDGRYYPQGERFRVFGVQNGKLVLKRRIVQTIRQVPLDYVEVVR